MLTVRIRLAWRRASVVVAAAAAGLFLPATGRVALAQVATAQPATMAASTGDSTTQPAAQTPDQVFSDLRANSEELAKILGDPKTLSDKATRKAAAPKAIPILKKMIAELDEIAVLQPDDKERILSSQDRYLAFLSVLGDADAIAKLADMEASKDVDKSLSGQNNQLFARWILAGTNAGAQRSVADDLEKLDKAHTDNIGLTILTMMCSQSAVSPDLKIRLESLVADTMNNDEATELKKNILVVRKLRLLENKPLAIAAKRTDGKDFTTADWKGKVILVDFWATWCPPCVADLPRMKKAYADYHDKGLEIVGVDNDASAQDVNDFVTKNEMSWPQLFDAASAGPEQLNSITTGFGISTIPMMFLIDKKGILRTVEADDNMEDMIPKLLAE
jgi:thiol-disulfide isomerase/thioredoxin